MEYSHHGDDSSQQERDSIAVIYEELKSGKPIIPEHMHHHETPAKSTREVNYKGHNIIIRTTYEIEVDGKPLDSHIFVDNNGKVSSHTMPNYYFPSTVDLVENLIDNFPENFQNQVQDKGDE